jgi:hypothetical protein
MQWSDIDMLKMIFLALLLAGFIFNLVAIESYLSIRVYGHTLYIRDPPLSLTDLEQQQSSSVSQTPSGVKKPRKHFQFPK